MPEDNKPAPEEERVLFVKDKMKKQDLAEDEIIVRNPFPRETKWTPASLRLDDDGGGIIGGLKFNFYGQTVKAKIDDEVLEAIKLNKLQVVVGRLNRFEEEGV
jgi:hypothetical protein